VNALEAVAALWRGAGLEEDALGWLRLTGRDPVLPSSFAVGTAAQASLAAAGLAAASYWRLRGGSAQDVSVEMHDAAAEFISERLLSVDGKPPADLWDPIAGIYPTADGHVRIHTNFPHHRDGVLALLGCANDKKSVGAALAGWSALEFEEAAAAKGLCVTALRTTAEWQASPQGQAVSPEAVRIERIGDAPASPPAFAERPLSGLRVLDLTRIVAGPVCTRTLAAHGAEVLSITGPHLPSLPALIVDTGRGKRAASLDLRDAAQREVLAGLVRNSDVFVQGYRPGGLAALGFGPQDLAALRPGIVAASLTAYGDEGPWAARRGFDSLTQTASGFNADERDAAGDTAPRPLPCQALDHASGALLAFGIIAALHRRATEGGSWHVRVSLAGTGRWLRGLGRIADGFAAPAPDFSDAVETSDAPIGRVTAARHAVRMSATPPAWTLPTVPIGTHPARWVGGLVV
jgi:crotonobetainyl-CoA:carnitine CoA-transferase CaiB-like acyl-CoA transferase